MFEKRKQHKIALQIAREYNMEYDYLTARKNGYSPIEALEEFDLPTPPSQAQLTRAMARSAENKVHAS